MIDQDNQSAHAWILSPSSPPPSICSGSFAPFFTWSMTDIELNLWISTLLTRFFQQSNPKMHISNKMCIFHSHWGILVVTREEVNLFNAALSIPHRSERWTANGVSIPAVWSLLAAHGPHDTSTLSLASLTKSRLSYRIRDFLQIEAFR